MVLLLVICCFIFLEEGDVVEIICCDVKIFDKEGNVVECEVIELNIEYDVGDKVGYCYYMFKEIYEQLIVVCNVFKDCIDENGFIVDIFGKGVDEIFKKVQYV